MEKSVTGKVLFIDDDSPDLEIIAELLGDLGLSVVVKNTLMDTILFLQSAESEQIDIMVIDLNFAYLPNESNNEIIKDFFSSTSTNGGRYTGARILKAVREKKLEFAINKDVPAVFFSNIWPEAAITKFINDLKNVQYCHKVEHGVNELRKIICLKLEEKKNAH